MLEYNGFRYEFKVISLQTQKNTFSNIELFFLISKLLQKVLFIRYYYFFKNSIEYENIFLGNHREKAAEFNAENSDALVFFVNESN